MSKSKALPTDRDSQWKNIIETLFEDMIEFCLPDLYDKIDFSQKPIFLEQELLQILPNWDKKGKRLNDKLAKVKLKNGQEKWILIHVEAQDRGNPDFPKRMFVYYYRIFDRYKIPTTALAIYTGKTVPSPENKYESELFGTKITYEFNVLNIRDSIEEDLKNSSNPFALAALACFYTIKSHNNQGKRYAFKKYLVSLLAARNYPREKIVNLFRFIQYTVNLSRDMEDQFVEEIKQEYNTPNKMSTTEQTKMSEADIWFEDFLRQIFGTTVVEEKRKLVDAMEKTEAEVRRTEAAKRQAEAEKQKAEAEKQKAEAEKRKAEAEKWKAEADRQKYIIRLFEIGKQSPDQIAILMELDIAYVEGVLKSKGISF